MDDLILKFPGLDDRLEVVIPILRLSEVAEALRKGEYTLAYDSKPQDGARLGDACRLVPGVLEIV